MPSVARYVFPWAMVGLAIWALATAASFWEAVPILGLLVVAVAAYGVGVTDAQEGWIKMQVDEAMQRINEAMRRENDER